MKECFRRPPASSLTLALALTSIPLAACSEKEPLQPGTDAGQQQQKADAGQQNQADAGQMAGCTQVSFDAQTIKLDDAQDVQTIYSAALTTNLGAQVADYLVFNFVNINPRFGQAGIGSFSLSEAPNDNRGTCGDCISVFVDQVTPNATPQKVFFQSAGQIELSHNPRSQVFKGKVSGLKLIEVTIDPGTLQSTPVPNGECLEVAEFTVDYRYVPDTWTCDPALYRAGDYMCNCDCGAPDPDCACDPFMDPNCPGTIPDDCPMGTTCTAQGCVAGCDPFATPPVGCPAGELCVFDFSGPVCQAPGGRLNNAQLGQTCQGLGNLIQYCAIQNNAPQGVCDEFDQLCKPICRTSMNTCSMGETCYTFAGGGGPGSEQYGWCRMAGAIPPEEWTCEPGEYGEGQACHCNCGAVDPDCINDELELPVIGCMQGQTCTTGTCQ